MPNPPKIHRPFVWIAAAAAAVSAGPFCILAVNAAVSAWLMPVGDGAYKQWLASPATSTHYVLVDESTCNNNTDYIYTTSTPPKSESFRISLSSVPNGSVINKIEITPCAATVNSQGTNSTMQTYYLWNGISGAAQAQTIPTTSFNSFTKTWSGLSLSKNASSTLEIGVGYSFGNKGLKLSNIKARLTY